MNATRKSSIVRRFGLLVWAWATLILCVVLVLLVNQMLREGRNPISELNCVTDALPEEAGAIQAASESLGTREDCPVFAPTRTGVDTETAVIEYSPKRWKTAGTRWLLVAGPKQQHLLP